MLDFSQYFSNPLRSITTAVRSLIRRRQAQMPDEPIFTTELGTAASVSPRTAEQARIYVERYDRRSVIHDVKRMLADNPLLAEAAQVFVDTAVSKGFSVNVERTSARGVQGGNQRKAQRIIDRLIRDAKLRSKIPSWGRMLISEGDLFCQNVEYRGELINVKRMPAVTMERNSDVRDAFPDVLNAYHQIDVATNETLAQFALWQITHARWNFVDGERYGSSQYLQLRRMSRVFLGMINDMAIRRRTRGPLRYLHNVGTQEHPGKPAEMEAYKRDNGFTDLDKRGELQITTDFFGNGLTKIDVLKGDARLGEIEDVAFVLNVLFPRTGMAKGIIGFGENVSRDILDEQMEFLHTKQDLLIDVLEWDVIRPAVDLALLIEGINPDSIVYDVTFEERMSEAGKLAKVDLYVSLHERGLMTEEQVVLRIAPYIGVKDTKSYLADLLKWRAERRKQQQKDAAARDEDEKPDDAPAPPGRSNVRQLTRRSRV